MKIMVVSGGGHGGRWVLGTHGVPNSQDMERFDRWVVRKYPQRGVPVEPKQVGKTWGRYGYDTVPGHLDARQP